MVGYHRYDTTAELLLLNKIWVMQSKLTNYFYLLLKLISKVRTGAKVSKKYDKATTPHRRAETHSKVAAAYGIRRGTVLHYLADTVDPTRMPDL